MKAKVVLKNVVVEGMQNIGEVNIELEYSLDEMTYIRTEAPKFFDEVIAKVNASQNA